MGGKFEGHEGARVEAEVKLDDGTKVTIAKAQKTDERGEYLVVNVDTTAKPKGPLGPKPPPPPPKGKTLIAADTVLMAVENVARPKGPLGPKPPPPPPKGFDVLVAVNVFEPDEGP